MSFGASVSESIRTEAERWFGLMMAPDCPPERLLAFQRWLQAAPEHRQAYLQVERLWERLGEAVQRPGVRALPEAAPPSVASFPSAPPSPAPRALPALGTLEFRPRPRARAPRSWRRWAGALAACLVLVAISALVYPPQARSPVYTTAIGETRSLTLADGSMVTLDTDSRVEVAYDARGRHVALQRGAAFFDVSPDAARPFTVATPLGSATVLGTQFQVRQDPAEMQVVLVKGAVRLDAPDAGRAGAGARVLRPGQQARRGAHTEWRVAAADPASTAWRQGRLVFRATPLAQAVAEVNRYTAQKLRIADPALEALAVSGVFRTGDPDSFVLVLENSLPVRAQAGEDGRLLRAK